MRIKNIFTILFTAGMFSVLFAQTIFNVAESGKRIQRDGFLLDWKVENSVSLIPDTSLVICAINTPEGLAGYLKYSGKAECSSWKTGLYSRAGVRQHPIEISFGDTAVSAQQFTIDKAFHDSLVSITAEWILPWEWVAPDSDGHYEVGLLCANDCRDSSLTCIIKGTHSDSRPATARSSGLINQAILTAGLLGIYLYLRARTKKYANKKPNDK
jgi:hypothetical protein